MVDKERRMALARSSRAKPSRDGKVCNGQVETYSRVTGFYRPAQHFNKGKTEEFLQRRVFKT